MELGIVQGEPAFQVLVCALELAQVVQRCAEAPLRDHLDVRIADLGREAE